MQDQLIEVEKAVRSKCASCGEHAKGRRDEHLLFGCTSKSVVKLRREVEGWDGGEESE